MNILAIETSCDETSVAILRDGTRVLTNQISSQIDLHAKTGGIVPEVAAREQLKAMQPVLDEALSDAGMSLADIDEIAVTRGPGLIGSLLVGVNAAKTLAYILGKPLLGINHLEGHIYSDWLEREESDIQFPVLVLVVSGGHNELLLLRGHGAYSLIGKTRDDAAGEAFDKTARLIGLPYPGGMHIQRVAESGDPKRFIFPRAWLQQTHMGEKPKQITNFDFSFSGMKTSVWQKVEEIVVDDHNRPDFAASIQEAIVDVLVAKTVAAAQETGALQIHIAGGVSANERLRTAMQEKSPVPVLWPRELAFCTDNAAMIGCAGYFLGKDKGLSLWQEVETDPNLAIIYETKQH